MYAVKDRCDSRETESEKQGRCLHHCHFSTEGVIMSEQVLAFNAQRQELEVVCQYGRLKPSLEGGLHCFYARCDRHGARVLSMTSAARVI